MANNSNIPFKNTGPAATKTPLAQAIQNPASLKSAPATSNLPQQNRILNLPFTFDPAQARR